MRIEFMKTTLLLSALTLLTGCANFTTTQTDVSPERTITTTVKATALFTSSQIIEKLKATTTDKAQSVGTSGIDQQAVSANAVKFMESAERIAEKFVKP